MSTRLKRRSRWRQLALMCALVAFQGYLAFNVIGGQYGIDSQRKMQAEIEELKAKSSSYQAQIDAYRHRVSLFDPANLDPDILTERARALLSMASAEEIVVMIDPETGLPVSSSQATSTSDQLSHIIEASSEQ